ncbi:hypothetical protein AAFF_G00388210 [Aldrovandia affinis]|uniref:Uncharacterized protein n=1 Tax=Aldrovandia affinis TaxID=143900 RepID=A0AAD7SF15_9TELE|nr:hypothetical protein AAFF_G00388210 [Aldrovandia affinis]
MLYCTFKGTYSYAYVKATPLRVDVFLMSPWPRANSVTQQMAMEVVVIAAVPPGEQVCTLRSARDAPATRSHATDSSRFRLPAGEDPAIMSEMSLCPPVRTHLSAPGDRVLKACLHAGQNSQNSQRCRGVMPIAPVSPGKVFNTPCLDLECFLSAKAKLRQEGLLDSVLKVNLEHAIQALESMPAVKRSNVSLLVEGERQLVKFTSGSPVIHYAVKLGPAGPELQQKIHVGARLTPASVVASHFAGHRCQDEFEPCLEQAQRAVREGGVANAELRVVCNELHLTYATHQPSATITKALEVKNWMEQRGMMGGGLLACFQHLLVSYSQYQEENAKLVLQSEGQIVELISGRPDYHNVQFYIFANANNEIQSQRVQNIDLWDDD